MKMISPTNREVDIGQTLAADEYIGMVRREVMDGFMRDRAIELVSAALSIAPERRGAGKVSVSAVETPIPWFRRDCNFDFLHAPDGSFCFAHYCQRHGLAWSCSQDGNIISLRLHFVESACRTSLLE